MNVRHRVGKFVATVRLLIGRTRGAVWLFLFALSASLAGILPLLAHEGHDYGDHDQVGVPATDDARLSARTAHFQIVAVPNNSGIVVYVDDGDRNAPVTGAKVTITGGEQTAVASESDPGTYSAEADWLKAPGSQRLTVSVNAGGAEEQASGILVSGRAGVSPPTTTNAAGGAWLRDLAVAGLGFGLAIVVFRPGRARWGGALLALLMVAVLLATASFGHEEAQPSTATPSEAPHRHPDGSVFLPKETQRLLEVRTQRAQASREARRYELVGRVVLDPNKSAHVQAVRAGRIEPGPDGFPHLGQKVDTGQVLAYLMPTLSAFEESSLRQTLTQIERDMELLVPRADAIGTVNPNMPQSDATAGLLQELQIQSQALTQQKKAVLATLNQKIEVKAPIAGLITSANVTSGQVVAERDSLFEIVDGSAARVQAWSFDSIPPDDIAEAAAVTEDGRTFALAFVGRGRVLQQQAVPLLFEVSAAERRIEIGAPVRVLLSGKRTVEGITLPAVAVVRGPDNLPTVWEHTTPETFIPHVVRTLPLDGERVLVTSHLASGIRVVIDGAAYVNQVR